MNDTALRGRGARRAGTSGYQKWGSFTTKATGVRLRQPRIWASTSGPSRGRRATAPAAPQTQCPSPPCRSTTRSEKKSTRLPLSALRKRQTVKRPRRAVAGGGARAARRGEAEAPEAPAQSHRVAREQKPSRVRGARTAGHHRPGSASCLLPSGRGAKRRESDG
jgi:hypothetical protein